MGARVGHRAGVGRPLQPQCAQKTRRTCFEGGILSFSHLQGLCAPLTTCGQPPKCPPRRRKPPPPRMLGGRGGQASLLAGAPRRVCFACPQTSPQRGGQSRQPGLTRPVTHNQPGRAPDCNLLEGASRFNALPRDGEHGQRSCQQR